MGHGDCAMTDFNRESFPPLDEAERKLLFSGKKVDAIIVYRNRNHPAVNLTRAKQVIDHDLSEIHKTLTDEQKLAYLQGFISAVLRRESRYIAKALGTTEQVVLEHFIHEATLEAGYT